ncbi:MAG: PAAR domain-containing protein [Aeromonas sp.]
MAAAARKGDKCTGHGDFPPRASISGSANVLINGLPALCVGDEFEPHCNSDACHGGKLTAGSGSVFVNGKALGRVGDALDCGSTVAEGSSTVNVGG